MDAVTMAALTAVGTAVTTAGSAYAMNAQGQNEKQRAAVEGQWADRRANEERASSQIAAGEEERKARIVQSRLTAVAGASGSRADDVGVKDLWGDIGQEGNYNSLAVRAEGEKKATGIEYQSALDRMSADANASLKSTSAGTTLLGGLLSAGGKFGETYYNSRMATKHGSGDIGVSTGGTGYGRYQ